MDDTCAVCADNLQWVAYGACGHQEVCSTCVVRLRFILDDRNCCICKTESHVVFVTKALGQYTRMVNDFSVLPSEPREGRVGSFWYHEDTQAFFDDIEQYKMIKEMCRLSCSVCDNMEQDGPKHRVRFRNIEQLKGHLYHRHKLHMCSLCLEGRKIFICEQKLYTRTQLNQHICTGDSEVDGSESERGGFMGHPLCEFCKSPFYGDNELYLHMSTEHFTCHLCQRQHPGQYEYYKNYDDLEIHFRREHCLCEDESCLAKKFIVFQNEAELKRHNTIEHGGRMSRSQRSAALQLPTSFRYQRNNEQDRRGRGRTFRRESGGNELSLAIEASLATVRAEGGLHAPSPSSSAQVFSDNGFTDEVDPLIHPFESLATSDETPSRYRQALGHNSQIPLGDSSFPPLPIVPGSSQQNSRQSSGNSSSKTMAANLRRQKNKNNRTPSAAPAWSGTNHGTIQSSSTSTQFRPATSNSASALVTGNRPALPSLQSSGHAQARQTANGIAAGSAWNASNANRITHSASAPNLVHSRPVEPSASDFPPVHLNRSRQLEPSISDFPPVNLNRSRQLEPSISDFPPVNVALTRQGEPNRTKPVQPNRTRQLESSASDFPPVNLSRTRQVEPAPINHNLSRQFESSVSDFPPVSTTQKSKSPLNVQTPLNVQDVQAANKSLVENIRAGLGNNDNKFTAFKDISGRYRQGLIDTGRYMDHVREFGLSHLVPEMARLCPDAQKQKELLESYNATLRKDMQKGKAESGSSRNGKGKSIVVEDNRSKDALADSVLDTVRKLQSSYTSDGEVEVLAKDGYRAAKGKSKVKVDEQPLQLISTSQPSVKLGNQNGSLIGNGAGGNKQRKKTSKFNRMRLGDGSMLALSNHNSDPEPDEDLKEMGSAGNLNNGGLPARSVWRRGGASKLFS